ncbi:Asp-tRNA(Asn)/Glu-tRNA(Gln) amidotransferase subunit GatC [Cognatazoarcus halotolerans]|uniref:Asp-tRNA(Asn)/Glu-tRNA(Gln) amidotransferase subunit GatC n=1 Tax=Cognatazoarcus halotolerans TaxID=2686016 RepID=UPI001357AE51|nr:Asp-tRNA(Asn)/Glu-tRNA(Gln) amidotransferase subunit GatC [Cognatazoarcus halotolerans]MCB1898209.1 Asp-tRNA(Asn)/Glu-tRNA(Gln) amidotransferase subunit GatC [Rhodocyclaceae bacterium]MCP5311708.1 Asp-tRNA(Asn)/Glu-tRNA(Gln) amidotransferase subunit GatC [Zoogloeaceae bacterium]
MSLDQDQIKHIARLARIELSPGETGPTLDKLNGVFALIEQMQAVDTTGVEPMSHPQDVSQRLRQDAVSETDRHEAFQRIAPQTEAGLYLVPRVIE